MTKKCVYCECELSSETIVDVCEPCGRSVWGGKGFQAIKDNMSDAKQRGDLYQGSVGIYEESDLQSDFTSLN